VAELRVGDHVWFDKQAVTVVHLADERVWWVHGHLDYQETSAEEFRLLGSGW